MTELFTDHERRYFETRRINEFEVPGGASWVLSEGPASGEVVLCSTQGLDFPKEHFLAEPVGKTEMRGQNGPYFRIRWTR